MSVFKEVVDRGMLPVEWGGSFTRKKKEILFVATIME